MKKIILIFLIILNLNADSILPDWIKNDPDTKGKYFKGISAWYVSDDARMEALSKKDATKNAYSFVSQYFGVNVQSSVELEDKIKNNIEKSNFKSSIKTKSNQLILNLKPIKSYKEYDDSEKNFRLHVLLLLDKPTEEKINLENTKDREEFEDLKQKVLLSIEQKQYFKAKNYLTLAKGKRSAYLDTTLKRIENRLIKLMNGVLQAKLNINKTIYMPEELIHLEASLNKKGYIYIFYVTGSDVEMVFPNKHKRVAYIKKEQLISFDEQSPYTLIAYEEDLKKDLEFYTIASTKNLGLKSLCSDSTDDVYIFSKNGKYLDIINRCIDEGKCTKNSIKFTISNTMAHKPIKLVFQTNNIAKRMYIDYFKSKGIVTTKANKKIIFKIKNITKHSKQLNSNIKIVQIEATLFKNDKSIKILNDETTAELTNETLFSMYKEFTNL